MSNHKNKRRVSKSLRAPFTLEELTAFVASIPKRASVRLVSVFPPPGVSMEDERKEASFLEALWWEKS